MSIESPLGVSLQDIANIVTFIAPGYFAITIYAIKYAKTERNIWKLVIESIVWSLPLIALTNYIWEQVFGKQPVTTLDKEYTVILLTIAVIAGFLAAWLRQKPPINWIVARLGIDSPHEDFIRIHFETLDPQDPVSVKLKSGAAFSGTPSKGSIYSKDGPRKYCFEYIAWYDDKKEKWEETDDTLMVDFRDIEYIVSPSKEKKIETATRKRKVK